MHINLPPNLTEEEEILRQKYARLRKKKKQLQTLKSLKPEKETTKEKPVKRLSESAEDAKEQAKKLVMSGAIKLSDKREKHEFKRSRNFEKKLQDPEKMPQPVVGFTPFAATHVAEEREEPEEKRPRTGRPKGLYDNFVRGDRQERGPPPMEREEPRFEDRGPLREDRGPPMRREERGGMREDRAGVDRMRPDRLDRRERGPPPPTKGNTLYVFGHGVTEEILRKAFSNFGTIVNISMENAKHCGFVTFEKMESADLAIQEVGGAMVDSVQLKVQMARRQPSFDATTVDQSTSSWASIASNNSQKGSHKDKRNVVSYDEDDMF